MTTVLFSAWKAIDMATPGLVEIAIPSQRLLQFTEYVS
jgi:hypothetical protein